MAINPLQHVQPGDLITSAWANGVVDEINAIVAQLAALGSPPDAPPSTSGPPVLTTRSPLGDVHVNDNLTLFGQNFTPRHNDLTRVNFGSVQIPDSQFLLGSSDTQLRFTVPDVPPGPVNISVSTPQGTSVHVLSVNVAAAAAPQGGTVHVDTANDPNNPPKPLPNQPLQLQWKVSSDTISPDDYTFDITFSEVTPSTQTWSATLNANEQTIDPNAPFTVVATVQVPSGGSAKATLTATSTTDSTRHDSNTLPLAVNVSTPTSDPRIALRVVDPQPDFDNHGNPNNAFLTYDGTNPVINVVKNASAIVEMQVHFSDTTATPPLNYRFFSQVADTAHWSAGTADPATLVQMALGGTTTVIFNLSNLATDAATNETQITVSAAKLKPDLTTDDYVSFTPVTLRNAG